MVPGFRSAFLVILAVIGGGGLRAQASTDPVLRLETGLHTNVLRALSASGDGRWVLTASEDKTARLWELPTGRLARTFRPAVGEGNTGKLLAGALSPDGSLVALGGWVAGPGGGFRVILADARSGEFLRFLEVGPTVVNFLAFSPDGTRLAVHLGGRLGLRFYRPSDGVLVGQDGDYDQPTYRGAFDGRGRYAATSDDGFVRLYDPSGQRLNKVRTGEAAPFGVAFRPDGSALAVAHADSPKVVVLRGEDLGPGYVPAPGTAPLGVVAWSADGRSLLASGGEDYGPKPNVLRRWADGGRGAATETPLARATVSDLVPLSDGSLLVASQEPSWSLWGSDGRPRLTRAVTAVDLRQVREAFRVSADGLTVALPGEAGAFSVGDLNLVSGSGLPAPLRQVAGLAPADWLDSEHPQLGGRPLVVDAHEVCRVVSVAPEGRSLVLGTDWWLRAFDAQGTPLWRAQAPAPVWGLAHRGDGRALAAFLADGTVRWYRASDGREVLALYVAADRRWVAWTPSGRFATSVGGEDLVGWQVNREGQAGAFFPVGHFRDRFYQPELLPLLLDTLDEAAAVARLNAQASAGGGVAPVVAAPLLEELPPVVRVVEPTDGATMPAGPQVFRVSVRTFGRAKGVKGFKVFLDGQRLAAQRALRPQQKGVGDVGTDDLYAVPVLVPGRDVTVTLLAELADGRTSEAVHVSIKGMPAPTPVTAPGPQAGPGGALAPVAPLITPGAPAAPASAPGVPQVGAAPAPLPLPTAAPAAGPAPIPPPPPGAAVPDAPNLRVLAVGVATYANPKNNLKFSAKDAKDVADLFEHQAGRLYGHVDCQVLLNEAATEQGILAALDRLADSSNPASITVIFLSAHGASNPERTTYAFVTYDFGMGSRGLPGAELKARLERMQGKVLMLMDTCHSGNVLGEGRMRSLDDVIRRTRFINELLQAGPGSVVFSSSSGAQYSLESPAWGNGAFTKALKEGLNGAADPRKTGRVTTDNLDAWLRARVAELTQGKQTPVIGKSEGLPAFPLVLTR